MVLYSAGFSTQGEMPQNRPTPPSLDLFLLLFFYHYLISGIAILVAVNKDYPRFKWLIFGRLGGTLAFFVALFLEKKLKPNQYQREIISSEFPSKPLNPLHLTPLGCHCELTLKNPHWEP